MKAGRTWLALAAVALFAAGAFAGGRCEGACGVGTLAYVVSSCRAQGDSLTGWQELRVARSGRPPVTVMRIENDTPVADPFGLCELLGKRHLGKLSSLAGVFMHLGVTLDGTGVV